MGVFMSSPSKATWSSLELILTIASDANPPDTEIGWWFDFVDQSFHVDMSSANIALDLYFEPDVASANLVWAGSFYQDRGSVIDHSEEPSTLFSAFLSDVAKDCEEAARKGALENDNAPLWHSTNYSTFRWPHLSENQNWAFWRDWYQGFLDGKPLDWELQRRVALIPDQDWKQGPEHIARKIEEIQARFDLETRIKELEAEKQVWQERARLGIGGNNPPETIEDARIVQEIIWAPVEELKAETQSDAPDKSRIISAISKLKALIACTGIWAFAKADAALEQALNDYLPKFLEKHGDKLGDLLKAAQDWLGTLP